MNTPKLPPLPERDTSKPAEQQGVFRKFDVRRTDGSDNPGGKHHGCEYFVLDVDHDQAARAALKAYADAVEATHPLLAADMRKRYDLAAIEAQGVPDGWQLVPKAITPKMAASVELVTATGVGQIYERLLASAPPAPQAEELVLWKARALQAEAIVAKFMEPQAAVVQQEPPQPTGFTAGWPWPEFAVNQAKPQPLSDEQRRQIILRATSVGEAIAWVERHYGIKE